MRREDASCRPLQPTHDTSTRGSFDFRAHSSRCADRRILPRPVRAGFFRTASDHLAAIQPRLGARLTARLQLRSSRFMAPLASRLGGCQTPVTRCHPGLALSATHRVGERPLTLPVVPLETPARAVVPKRNQNRFHRPLVNGDDFPDPERLSSTGAPKKRRCSRPFRFGGSPPPISRLSHRRSGFRRSFTPPALSRRRARPILVSQRLFVSGREGPRAACRLLQSIRPASTTTDRRTPHNLASGRPPAQPIS
jgi:hypothetical protein